MTNAASDLRYGANVRGDEVEFRVWAPDLDSMKLRMVNGAEWRMQREGEDFVLRLPARPSGEYFYVIGTDSLPDPVSRFLPTSVHGPSSIIDPGSFRWTDSKWSGLDLREFVLYELHIGTFTLQGTFDAAAERLPYLKQLGVTAIELMPVAAFPGTRNWGYDGVSLYAVQASYGGPEGLKRLVDAAHSMNLAVIQDVVYNHFGPEGNYLRRFGPYFTDRHTTPWGEAINYDQPGCEGVRRFVIDNALYWIREYHLDGLRLDAVQTIRDESSHPIVMEIASAVHGLGRRLGRTVCVIAETDENVANLVRPVQQGGFGLDALWSDDFHHSVHAHLTDEHQAYYQDFGSREQIVTALNQGFVFRGEHFKFWNAPRGTPADDVPLYRHVICLQNHDQVGNRAFGERLTQLIPRGARKLFAAFLLLAPHTPMLWMGEEYDETAPFQFFSDFEDPALQKSVTEGRRREFKDFNWTEIPDPQDSQTFLNSKLCWPLDQPQNREMLEWYRALLQIRREHVVGTDRTTRAELRDGSLVMQIPATSSSLMVVGEFPDSDCRDQIVPGAEWKQVLSSAEDDFSVAVYVL